MKYFFFGDSHGPKIFVYLSGFPSGVRIDFDSLNKDLLLRKSSFGRGKRMKMESDKFEIISGVYNGVTTGAPITFAISNLVSNTEKGVRSIPRPGHGDYSSYKKYKIKDFNVYAERNSARWTAALTLIGSLCRQVLNYFDLDVVGYVSRLGDIELPDKDYDISNLRELRNSSKVYCPDKTTSEMMISELKKAITDGNTLGGEVTIVSTKIPGGLGDYGEIENKLDSKIASILLAIPSVKGVTFGEQIYNGKDYLDPFVINNGSIDRSSNNCGGIEAGFTNGSPLKIKLFVKPIPTLKSTIQSVDIKSMKEAKSPYIRSDYTSVPSVAIISEAAISLVLLDTILERFGNGNVDDIKKRVENELSSK